MVDSTRKMLWFGSAAKTFDCVWILKVLDILKISPVLITFLKYNMQRWQTNLRLIPEKGMFKTNNLNINNEIFPGDLVSPLLFFFIALILLPLKLRNHDLWL